MPLVASAARHSGIGQSYQAPYWSYVASFSDPGVRDSGIDQSRQARVGPLGILLSLIISVILKHPQIFWRDSNHFHTQQETLLCYCAYRIHHSSSRYLGLHVINMASKLTEYKPLLRQLYIDKNLTAKQIAKYMHEEHQLKCRYVSCRSILNLPYLANST